MKFKDHILYWDLPMTHREGKYRVLDHRCRIVIDNRRFVIPAGFKWDGASIPRVFWASFGTPFDCEHEIAGMLHDAIYAGVVEGVTREEADKLYRLLLRACGQGMIKAFLEYRAVRRFGESHWMTATLLAALLMTCSGCQTWNAIPSEWKAAGASAALNWAATFFAEE